jgi:hypothetical protein
VDLVIQDTLDYSDGDEWKDEEAGSDGEEGEGSPHPPVSVISASGSRRSSGAQTLEGVYPPPLKMTAKRTGGRPLRRRDTTPTREAIMITRNDIPKHELLDRLFRKLMEFSPDELTASLDSEKYRTLVLDFAQNPDFQALPSIREIFPFGPSKVCLFTFLA